MLQYQEAVEKRKTVISQALGAVALGCESYYRHVSPSFFYILLLCSMSKLITTFP